MRILALDLSLTATGWAVSLDEFGVYRTGDLRGMKRLRDLDNWLFAMATDDAEKPKFDLAVIEGYSYASANQAHQIGEWGGVARLTLYDLLIPVVEIPPKKLKKFATNNGNAPKPDMRMELYKRAHIDVADDNTVDALWLLAAARDAAGKPLWTMPKVNREALVKVEWPKVRGSV